MSALVFWNRATTGDQPLYSPYRSADIAAGAQAVNRSSAFLVWDILITVDDEVQLIWPRTWSYTKVVYFIVRYLPVLVQISILFIGTEITPQFHFTPHDCYIWQIYQGVAASMVIAIVDTVLVLRVHALYHGHQIVRRVVAVFYVLEIAGMAVGLALTLPGITFDNVCLVVGVPRTIIIYGGSSIIFQFILFGFTLYKFVQAARSGWGDVPLVMLLMRDGTWAFFLLLVAYVGQLCLYAVPKPAFDGILYGWLLTAFSIAGYRILLNLKNAAGAENRNTRSMMTDIQFTIQFVKSGRDTTTTALAGARAANHTSSPSSPLRSTTPSRGRGACSCGQGTGEGDGRTAGSESSAAGAKPRYVHVHDYKNDRRRGEYEYDDSRADKRTSETSQTASVADFVGLALGSVNMGRIY
ncbi:hypothetical protein CPC08DRAFT_757861 [Agrocybe pediades]|nr:hypothetical protein CPC08DRAFT_757861 [Agrocybe pediades]